MRTIQLEEALQILSQPRQRGGRAAAAPLKELGEHPTSKQPMRILKGRFGPYVTDGVVNASIPSGRDPEAITFDDAIELIAAREAKLREQGQDPRAPKASGRSGSRTTRRSSSRSSSPRRRSA